MIIFGNKCNELFKGVYGKQILFLSCELVMKTIIDGIDL